MDKQRKNQKGITLIALVITIIVLLILAGVSLSLVVGQNGILSKATTSVDATKKAAAIEQVSLAWGACQTDYLASGGTISKSTCFSKENLTANLSEGEVTAASIGVDSAGTSELVYKIGDVYYKMQVTADGVVTIIGEGTNTEPTINWSLEDTCTVTKSGTNVTHSNSAEKVKKGTAYEDTITAEEGYTIKTITATMGGTEVATVVESETSGKVSIGSVTGNIVITVTAEEKTIIQTLTSQVSANNYGDYVNYSVDLGLKLNLEGETAVPKTDWRIFYKDDKQNRVYLIAADYVPNICSALKLSDAGMSKNGSYSVCWYNPKALSATARQDSIFGITSSSYVLNSSNANSKCVSTLLDTKNWNGFVDGTYADYAIGGPTIEMYTNSWNAKGYKNLTSSSESSWSGYRVNNSSSSLDVSSDTNGCGNNLYYPHKRVQVGGEQCYGYWLSSPSAYDDEKVMYILADGWVGVSNYYAKVMACRPVISLISGVKATKNSTTGIWELSK